MTRCLHATKDLISTMQNLNIFSTTKPNAETKKETQQQNPVIPKKQVKKKKYHSNTVVGSFKFNNTESQYKPRYIYGNVKSCKTISRFRPIFPEISTTLYHLSQTLKYLILDLLLQNVWIFVNFVFLIYRLNTVLTTIYTFLLVRLCSVFISPWL